MTKNSKILVCDDDETLSYLLKEQLLEEGFTVDTVYDGKYAIEALKRKNYDLLLLDLNILIEGETGTGKELFAEYIHKHSTRADKPFVVINCASLPDQLIESELFGHERGAFTDAKNTKQGLVEIDNGGTLFLDEIGEMSLSLQPKLLRFLENGEYRRIGGVTNLNSNVSA